jgi:hypothetical protein
MKTKYNETFGEYKIDIEEITSTNYEVFIDNLFTGDVILLKSGLKDFDKALILAKKTIKELNDDQTL